MGYAFVTMVILSAICMKCSNLWQKQRTLSLLLFSCGVVLFGAAVVTLGFLMTPAPPN